MTLNQYLTKAEELGIDRASLARGFPNGPTAKAWESEFDNFEVSAKKAKPPPIAEDLSRFVCAKKVAWTFDQIMNRVREDLRPLYASLYKRRMTPTRIAELAGIATSQVHSTLRGEKMFHRANISRLLTREEKGMLRWGDV